MPTPHGWKSSAPEPQRTPANTPPTHRRCFHASQPEILVLTYLEAWIICLVARLGNQQLDIRVRHAGPRQLPLQFAPPQHRTHPRIWVNGKMASDERSRYTIFNLGRPSVKFRVPYCWTTRSGVMSPAAILLRQSLLASSNSAAAGALLGPYTQICSAYMSGTILARHGLDGSVSLV